jgi:hypothetical protein
LLGLLYSIEFELAEYFQTTYDILKNTY